MKMAEIKALSQENLSKALAEAVLEKFNLKLQKKSNSIKKNHQFCANRKTIARIKTFMTQISAE